MPSPLDRTSRDMRVRMTYDDEALILALRRLTGGVSIAAVVRIALRRLYAEQAGRPWHEPGAPARTYGPVPDDAAATP